MEGRPDGLLPVLFAYMQAATAAVNKATDNGKGDSQTWRGAVCAHLSH